MTKQERQQVQQAILAIHDGDYSTGMAALCSLIGWRYPAGEIDVKAVSVTELATGPNREFEWKDYGKGCERCR